MQRQERIAITVAKRRGNLIIGAAPRNQITDTHGYLLLLYQFRKLSLAEASGGLLLGLNLLFTGLWQRLARGDGDPARLHRLGKLALQLDGQQPIHEGRASDF